MSTLALGFIAQLNTGTTVHDGGFFDNQTIAVQLGNVTARVGQGNFIHLIWIQPNLALSALEDVGRQALLESKRNWKEKINKGEKKMRNDPKYRTQKWNKAGEAFREPNTTAGLAEYETTKMCIS